MKTHHFDSIEAVIKVTERCNINCTYCYIFNKESDLYESKPKQMSAQTVREVARLLANGALDTNAKNVRVIFHGGEPMMMKIVAFREMCEIFIEEIELAATISFTIQTNAMLVTDEWISLFQEFNITVGVSLDGPKHINDIARVDHRGNGTYDRVIAGVTQLFQAEKDGRLPAPGALCVIDPDQDGGLIFDHLARSLGFKFIDFLLPIETRDSMSDAAALNVGVYLKKVFAAWQELNDKTVTIRFFDKFYTFMTGFDRIQMTGLQKSNGVLILSISSDGTYGPDDTLRIVSDEYYTYDCRNTSILEYLNTPAIEGITLLNNKAPSQCQDCIWVGYCVGGSNHGRLVNRYSKNNGYDNKSVLCKSLDSVYGTLAKALIDFGYDSDSMFERLDKTASLVYAEEV